MYERFDAGLRSFIAARVGDPDAAEDVVQEGYLKIQTRIGTPGGRGEGRRLGLPGGPQRRLRLLQTRKPTQEPNELLVPTPDPTEEDMEQRLSAPIRGMLDGLSPEQKTALYLTEYEGVTQKDLAGELGISVSGAKSRVQRTRARLKTLLLDCCHFELDRRGKVINYYDREHPPRPLITNPVDVNSPQKYEIWLSITLYFTVSLNSRMTYRSSRCTACLP